jgi:hypothetical protein
MLLRLAAAQRYQALFLEPLINGPIFGELEPVLTASLERFDQALTDTPVDLPAGPGRANREVILPSFQLLVDLANEFGAGLKHCTLLVNSRRLSRSLFTALSEGTIRRNRFVRPYKSRTR